MMDLIIWAAHAIMMGLASSIGFNAAFLRAHSQIGPNYDVWQWKASGQWLRRSAAAAAGVLVTLMVPLTGYRPITDLPAFLGFGIRYGDPILAAGTIAIVLGQAALSYMAGFVIAVAAIRAGRSLNSASLVS